MNETNKISAGLGASLATMAIAPAFASPKRKSRPSSTPEKLEDPTTKYPKPPFKSQSQPWPALAGKMGSRPDHGEKSYKGGGKGQP